MEGYASKRWEVRAILRNITSSKVVRIVASASRPTSEGCATPASDGCRCFAAGRGMHEFTVGAFVPPLPIDSSGRICPFPKTLNRLFVFGEKIEMMKGSTPIKSRRAFAIAKRLVRYPRSQPLKETGTGVVPALVFSCLDIPLDHHGPTSFLRALTLECSLWHPDFFSESIS